MFFITNLAHQVWLFRLLFMSVTGCFVVKLAVFLQIGSLNVVNCSIFGEFVGDLGYG